MGRSICRYVVQDAAGNKLPDASVYVYQPGTTTAITETMYDAYTGGNILSNPLTSDANGAVQFYLDSFKRVDLRVTKPGYSDLTVKDVAVLPPDFLDPTTGHDHDGTDSKLIPAGSLADGAVNTSAKLADGIVTNAKLASDVRPCARVYHSVAQSIADGVLTALAFDTERYDTDTIHDTVTNNTRLTCKTAGKYRITANVGFAANGTGARELTIRLNGTTRICSELRMGFATYENVMHVSTEWNLAVNDYVEAYVYQNSGAALNVNASSAYSPEFMMTRVA